MGESKCLRETKGRRHPDVDPKVISKLRKFFAEHNQRFYELVGEDLGKVIMDFNYKKLISLSLSPQDGLKSKKHPTKM